ncbi:MAG: TlpA family protein disulfide reductase [Steroidobacteraceae bacterium]
MKSPWPMQRIGWASLIVTMLGAAAVLIYFSIRSTNDGRAAADSAFALRAHAQPRALPELAFADGDGTGRTLAGFRNRVVLLNIWATWCVPCREEMPALDRLQQKLGGPGFEVVALSIDAEGAAAVKRFYNEIGIRSLGIYVDPASRTMGALGLVGIPTTLLIDRQGREIGRRTGPAEWDGPETVRMIEAHLNGAKP